MVYCVDQELKTEIEAGFKDKMHNLPRNFVEIDMSNSGGTKHMECDVYACGANYLDFPVFKNWITELAEKYGARILVSYNTENQHSGTIELNAFPYDEDNIL